jgi:hypothetical protein
VSFGWLSNDFDDSGVIGDPTGATAERGAELFDAAVTVLASALGDRRLRVPQREMSPTMRIDGGRLWRACRSSVRSGHSNGDTARPPRSPKSTARAAIWWWVDGRSRPPTIDDRQRRRHAGGARSDAAGDDRVAHRHRPPGGG